MNLKERIYDKEIFPLMTKIIKICRDSDICMIASFELDKQGCDNLLCTTFLRGEAKSNETLLTARKVIYGK